jgi:hypothetical protein
MRPPKHLLILLPLAVFAALAASGCGGGGGGSSTASAPVRAEATPTPSKQELISQGDAICAEVNAAVGTVGQSEAEVQSQVTQVAVLYTGMVERIKALGAPEDEAGYAEFIAAAEKLAKIEGEAKLAAERADTTALGEAATKAAPALEEFESTAGAYGFEKCSEGPSAPTATAPSGATTGEEGGVEATPEGGEEAAPEEAAPEEVAPEAGGAGSGAEEAPSGGGGSGGGTSGGSSGGVGPG